MRKRFSTLLLALLFVSGCAESKEPIGEDAAAADGGTDARPGDLIPTRCATRPLDRACFIGAAYAQCGTGAPDPRIYCSSAKRGCRWISDGCPLSDYDQASGTDCSCSGPGCAPSGESQQARWLMMYYGAAPWTRDRAPLLPVAVDATAGGTLVAPSCTGCTDSCAVGTHPCSSNPTVKAHTQTDSVVVDLQAYGLMGWFLQIEVDLGTSPPKARVCRLEFSDYIVCAPGKPICATSGTVTVASDDPTALLHGRFSATFDDGVTIDWQL